MTEQRKRLDTTIRGDLRDFIEQESARTGRPMTLIMDDLLEFSIAHRRGEIIEQQSLPVIRDIVETALRKTKAELRAELRDDLRAEVVGVLQEVIRKSTDRVVALTLRAVRDAAIVRRLVYTIISKAYTPEFAQRAYEDAKEKVGKELSARTSTSESGKREQQ